MEVGLVRQGFPTRVWWRRLSDAAPCRSRQNQSALDFLIKDTSPLGSKSIGCNNKTTHRNDLD